MQKKEKEKWMRKSGRERNVWMRQIGKETVHFSMFSMLLSTKTNKKKS